MLTNITTIHIFIESAYRNENFHHSMEHRFFEHEAARALEDEEHTSISAFAHITGIYFRIVTQRWSSEEILKTFEEILNDEAPPFSKEERRRFEAEIRERKQDESGDLVESSTFKQDLEAPVPKSMGRFSDFVIRRSAVVCEWPRVEYFEKRVSETPTVPSFEREWAAWKGTEFHLVFFHPLQRPEDSLYEAIHTEFVRAYLKKLFVKDGGSYTIWSNLYNEAGYVHTGHYWRTEKKQLFTFERSDIEINQTDFEHYKRVVAFDTKIGHAQGNYAINTIVWLDPKKELAALESLNYSDFLEFLKFSPGSVGLDYG